MLLYHGTVHNFTDPDLSRGRDATDFGKGFYVTDSLKMAKDWRKGYSGKRINVYDLTLSQIDSCKLHIRRYKAADINWAKFVYNNRRGKSKNMKFDIIIGPLADNSYNKWFDKIDRGEISWDQLANKINYTRFKSIQYCFKTPNSIKLLKYVQSK